MSSVDSITVTSVSTVNQIEITSTSGITVTTVGTQGLAGPSAIMQKGVDATTIGSNGNGTFLVYDHANTQWTSSGSSSVANLTVEIQKLRIGGTGATVVSILDEDNMSSNSATSLATQQSIKAYVESRVGIDNLAALLASGNTTGGTNIVVSANDDITFTDTSKGLFGNSSDLQIYHDGTHSYIANSQGALKVATETSGITVNIGHTTSTVAIGDDLTVAGNQSITGTLGVTGTITGSLTGNVTGQVSDISNFTTANITENTNLYYTNERVDDQVNSLLVGGTGIILTYDDNAGTLTIDGQIGDITSVVAGDGLSGGGSSGDVTLTVNVDNASVEINSDTLRVKASGITNDMLAGSITNSKLANADFTINSNSLVLGNSLTLDTDDIGEGTNNQYYTTSRANSDFDTRLATKTTDNLTEGSSRLYFTTARANTAIDNRVTKSFVDNLGVEASSVTANSVALGTDTTGNYIQTISGTANKITVSGSGSESADVTLTLPDDVQIADSLTVAGNLTVNGTLTSLDTTNLDIEDNLFQLNAGLTGSPVNDSGMLINRGNQNNGIFMWDESVDKFTMGLTTANGSATGNITLASLGTLVVNVEGNLTGAVTGNSSTATTLQTPRSIALSGDVSASAVNFDGSGNITLTTTIEANSIALGTDTVGNYVASITGGTGVTITGGTGESSTPSVAIGQAVGTTDDVTFNQVTADIIGNIEGATEFEASAGEALSKGDAVYISGVSGNKPVVSKADSDDANKMPSFGLAKTDANLNANVSVVTFGTLAGLNTSSFSVGDTLYISTTAGGLTASAPTGESSLIQNIGKVQRSHASAGSIKVGGAGRTNATPNLNDGKIFLGNGSNQSVSTTLDSSVVPENTNLYYTDARVQAVSINNVVEDTTPQLGGDLASNGNDILFADNDKAVFGAGSDLQIYHDGSHSYIKDAGTGNLNIQANQLRIQSDTGENFIECVPDAQVVIRYNNDVKFQTTSTGIDVTGTATMDGLTVDGTGDLGTIGNGAFNQAAALGFQSDRAFFGYSSSQNALIQSGSGKGVVIEVNNDTLDSGTRAALFASNGDISFYNTAGSSQALFWDASAEKLGIGTTSPSSPNGFDKCIEIEGSSASLVLSDSDATTWEIGSAGGNLKFFEGTDTFMTINSSGALLLGTTDTTLYSATSGGGIYAIPNGSTTIARQSTGSTQPLLILNETGVDGTLQEFRKDGSVVGSIGTKSGGLYIGTDDAGIFFNHHGSGDLDAVIPYDVGTSSFYNGHVNLGASGGRFKDLYLSGTANVGGLTVDGNSTFNTSSTLFANLNYSGSNLGKFSTDGVNLNIEATSNLFLKVNSATRAKFDGNGDISFYEDTGSTAKFFWDASAERLGIGTTSPSAALETFGGTSFIGAKFKGYSGGKTALVGGDLNTVWFGDDDGSIGTTNNFKIRGASNTATIVTNSETRVTVDGSGNLLVGTTDDVVWNNSTNSAADNGHNLRDDGRAGFAYYNATANSNATVNINRTGSDGDLIRLFKSGSTVGSIGTVAGDMFLGTASTGVRFLDANNEIIPITVSSGGGSTDGTISLGGSAYRFKDLYLSGKAKTAGADFTGQVQHFAGNVSTYYNAANARYGQIFMDGSGFNIKGFTGSGEPILYNAAATGASHRFQVAGAEKVRITNNGLTFNGDTASANALDDYEEGTWTPTITFGGGSTGQSYDRRQGKYIKIGSLVYIQGHLYFTNKGSSTGQARLAGLPFPPSSNSSGTFSPIGDRGQLNTGGRGVNCYLQASSTSFALYDGGFDGSGNSDTNYGDFSNSTEIDVNFCYYTDA